MRDRTGAYRVLVAHLRQENHFKDPGIDGRIILKWMLGKWSGGA
jgi:hypothetical protein